MDDKKQAANNNNNNNNDDDDDEAEVGYTKGGLFISRQSSSRWTPTNEQIRILKELYYNNGVRSPSGDQIQTISATLRQYGQIEPKNVFYWFQNHKARHQRLHNKTNYSTNSHHPLQQLIIPLPNIYPAAPSVAVGHMGNYGYGSPTFDKSFTECSISSGGKCTMVGSRSHHMGSWIGIDPYSTPTPTPAATVFEKTKYFEKSMEDDDDDQEIETLPLFPIHGERNLGSFCSMKPEYSDSYYATTWYGCSDDGAAGSRTSLELSLKSYTTISPDDAI